jgi:putative phosphoribosyl transferase
MFSNRKEAGEKLSQKLEKYKKKPSAIVLGIPRGGVEIAAEIAKKLQIPLDILMIKKIGFPGNEEFAIGAVSSNEKWINERIIQENKISKEYLQKQIKEKQNEIQQRYRIFRGNNPMYSVRGKIVILADDGIATGATILLAVKILKNQQPRKIIVAIPVAPPEAIAELQKQADEIICLSQPVHFTAVGAEYAEFPQVSNEQVKNMLRKSL